MAVDTPDVAFDVIGESTSGAPSTPTPPTVGKRQASADMLLEFAAFARADADRPSKVARTCGSAAAASSVVEVTEAWRQVELAKQLMGQELERLKLEQAFAAGVRHQAAQQQASTHASAFVAAEAEHELLGVTLRLVGAHADSALAADCSEAAGSATGAEPQLARADSDDAATIATAAASPRDETIPAAAARYTHKLMKAAHAQAPARAPEPDQFVGQFVATVAERCALRRANCASAA